MSKIDIQSTFLDAAKQNNVPVTVILINGVKIRGVVKGFDSFMVELKVEKTQQMLYKHEISTIIPMKPINLKVAAQ